MGARGTVWGRDDSHTPLDTLGASSYAQMQFDVDDNAVRYALVLIWIKLDRDGHGPLETVPLRAITGPVHNPW